MQNQSGKNTSSMRGETTPEPTVFSNLAGLLGGFMNVGQGDATPKSSQPVIIDTKKYKPSQQFMNKFRGKNVLVTGAAGGIGSKVCEKLIKAEVGRLAMFFKDTDVMPPKIDQAIMQIDGERYKAETLDLREPQRIEQKFSNIMKTHFFGKLDAVILCHGSVVEKGLIGCTIPDYDQTMLVNVRSMVHIMSLAFPFLKQQKSTSITVLTSAQGHTPDPMATVMSIASAMVQQLVKCSALEGAYHGIRVNAVACGVTNTNTRTKQDSMAMKLTADENKKYLQLAAQDVPLLGRLTEPKEVAMSLLFLASDESSFTTGEILTIDGGQSLTTDRYDDYAAYLKREFQ